MPSEDEISTQTEDAGTDEAQQRDQRERTLTEKGLGAKIRTLKNKQTAALSAVTKTRNEITALMGDEENIHLVKDGLMKLNEGFSSYQECYEAHTAKLKDGELEEEVKRYNEKELSFIEYRKSVSEWIQTAENRLSEILETASQRSRSTTSSTKSALAHEKAKIAALQVQKEMLQKQKEAEEIQLEIEIAKAEAKSKIYQQITDQAAAVESAVHTAPAAAAAAAEPPVKLQFKVSNELNLPPPVKSPLPNEQFKDPLINDVRAKTLNPQANTFKPAKRTDVLRPKSTDRSNAVNNAPKSNSSTHNVPQSDQNVHIMQSMIDSQRHFYLPTPEVKKFKGDPIEYVSFMRAFESRILPNVSNSSSKLYYLEQLLEGEARDLIGGCMYIDSEQGYLEARKLLHREYGDPFKVATAYIKKATNWPTIKPNDGHGLKQLSYFLTKCVNAMQGIEHMCVLNHAPNMQSIVIRLPVFLQNKWRDHVCRVRQSNESQNVNFEDLVSFVTRQAESMNDPIYSREALGQTGVTKRERQNTSSYATNVSSPVKQCIVCDSNHDLDNCTKFKGMSLAERRDLLKSNRMCYSCYGRNHMSKNCFRKRTCKVCGKKHPTLLHDPDFSVSFSRKPQEKAVAAKDLSSKERSTEPESTCLASTSSCTERILQPILPVKVRQGNTGKCVDTYALYDSGSSGCFISEDLIDKLNAKSTKSNLKLQTLHGSKFIETSIVNNLEVSDLYNKNVIQMPKAFSRQEIPIDRTQIPTEEVFQSCPHLKDIADKVAPYFPHLNVGLLIGTNCPKALEPQCVIPTNGNGPFAVQYRHGWTINGPVKMSIEANSVTCNSVIFQHVETFTEAIQPESITKMFELDFSENDKGSVPGEKGLSKEDHKFMKKTEESCKFNDGHYEIQLPFREDKVFMPNNRKQAMTRLEWQKKKMEKNDKYFEDYKAFIDKIVEKGYAYKVPDNRLQGKIGETWYLPHHGVYHPKKNKLRVVFDCSANYRGSSLNDRLLQGPDLTSSLLGVLTRFRVGQIAYMADVESMFYQVKVPEDQHDCLRFLWWRNGNLKQEVDEYCMSVHIFGAASSPSVANYALRNTAKLTENTDVADTILKNFYVDDCLKAVKSEETAIHQINELRDTCAKGGFNLTKFICNNKEVMEAIPKEAASASVLDLDLNKLSTIKERALGTQWNLETDTIGFSIELKDQPTTRRGLLSVISSIYDPLGIAAPFVLPAKRLLQELCKEKSLQWDEALPEEQNQRWLEWKSQLKELEKVKISRCMIPENFSDPVDKQLHVFSDASSVGYGAVAYIRYSDSSGKIGVNFLMGKARVAPLNIVSIPRLELTAATVSVKIGKYLINELKDDLKFDSIHYHTDSMTVLGYIKNEKKRQPIFVANRVQLIDDYTKVKEWNYVESKLNPADSASRGMTGNALAKENRYLEGPAFLKTPEKDWPKQPSSYGNNESEDKETSAATTVKEDVFSRFVNHYSNWFKLSRATAVLRRFIKFLKTKEKNHAKLSTTEITDAGQAIVRYVQKREFSSEINALKVGQPISKNSSIFSLDPYLNSKSDLLCVGGRLRRSKCIEEEAKHPALLPNKHKVSQLIIEDNHRKLGHAGRSHVLASVRSRYWITKGNSAVRSVLNKCVLCRKTNGKVNEQKMADLPEERVNPAPPFTVTGVDVFGPFQVKDGRKSVKRYGVLFTCLTTRAIHLETVNSLETDSFIQSLRRFIARRGNVKILRSDNGTNFVGANRELKKCLAEMDDEVYTYLLKHEIDWIFNPPGASTMGGVWERQIRTVRKVLASLLTENVGYLDDETLRTLFCEIEAIVNSRPLTTVSSDDMNPLTPNHALGIECGIIVPPPGNFQRDDIYMRKRWRRVQYFTNLFWSKWKKEYLCSLQERKKWNAQRRNVQLNDIVLIKNEICPRNEWLMGKVIKVEKDDKNDVRSVMLKTKNGELRRPINKLVTLLPVEEQT